LFPRLKRRGPIEAEWQVWFTGTFRPVSTSEKTWPH